MTKIRVITTETDAPVYLSDRFGEWIPGRGPRVGDLTLSDRLSDKFGPGTLTPKGWRFRDGDPRPLMGDRELSFIALMQGKVGILTDIETALVEDPKQASRALERGSDDERTGNVLTAPGEFREAIASLQQKLGDLPDAFPYSLFFVAHGAVTFEGRLSAWSFTPLCGQAEMHYSSPYPDEKEIAALERMLEEAVFGERKRKRRRKRPAA